MRHILMAAALALVPALAGAEGFFGGGTFARLAAEVPFGAGPDVALVDVAAARREAQRLDPGAEEIAAWAQLRLPTGFDGSGILVYDMEAAMGFGLGDIDALAGWGEPPDVAVLLTGSDRMVAAMTSGAALAARGFERGAVQGAAIWTRGEDHSIDLARRGEDPFSGPIGAAARFALRGDALLFARSTDGIARLLAGGPGLGADPDAAAIVAVLEAMEGVGAPVQLHLLRPPRPWAEVIAGVLGRLPEGAAALFEDPIPVPRALRIAAAEWQEAGRVTGGLILAYGSAEMAGEAAAGIVARLARTQSLSRPGQSFEALMGGAPEVRVMEVGGRHLAALLWTAEAEPGGDRLAVMRAAPLRHLLRLHETAELGLLVSPD